MFGLKIRTTDIAEPTAITRKCRKVSRTCSQILTCHYTQATDYASQQYLVPVPSWINWEGYGRAEKTVGVKMGDK